ncbi:MAG: outer membrane lipoprotein-sorting protein [Nitrospirota bacterium]
MIKRQILIAALFLILNPLQGIADDSSAKELLVASDRARGGNLPGLVWDIHVEAMENATPQKRDLRVKADNNNSLVEFLAPLKVKDQKLLMRERNMWFIRSGLRKPVPISPRQKLTGQAANGDIASTNYSGDYTAELLREETIEGEACTVLDLKAANQVTYDRIVYWISKKRLVGVKAEFYTVSGKQLKSASFEYQNEIPYHGRKIPFISKMIITDALDPSNITTLEYSNIKIEAIPLSTFDLAVVMQ